MVAADRLPQLRIFTAFGICLAYANGVTRRDVSSVHEPKQSIAIMTRGEPENVRVL